MSVIVSKATLVIQAPEGDDALIDAIHRRLAAERDELAEVYVSITETSRELERG